MPGPSPKRSNERRRRNAVPGETSIVVAGVIRVPRLPKGVHAVARAWYSALRDSGQAAYMEPSDWAAAVFCAMTMTSLLTGDVEEVRDFEGNVLIGPDGKPVVIQHGVRFTAAGFKAVWHAMESLLTTESARRRARMEVQRAFGNEDAATAAPDVYREMLGSE